MHASSGAEARLRASSSEFAAHARRPRARAHAPGGGRAGSRRGIRTRRRMQAGMDTCGLAHASEAAPGRQERRPARRRALAASPGSRRNLALRIPISPIGLSQFWAGVHKPYCQSSKLRRLVARASGLFPLIALYSCACSSEVTVTSIAPPFVCVSSRYFEYKPSSLSPKLYVHGTACFLRTTPTSQMFITNRTFFQGRNFQTIVKTSQFELVTKKDA